MINLSPFHTGYYSDGRPITECTSVFPILLSFKCLHKTNININDDFNQL